MDRRNRERLWPYGPDAQRSEYPDYDEDHRHEDPQDYRSHSSLDADADLRRQRECRDETRRPKHGSGWQSSRETEGYAPKGEVYGRAYEKDAQESDYQRNSGYAERPHERKCGHGGDYEDHRHGAWDTGHSDFRQSHDSDFYEDWRQSAVIGRKSYNSKLHDDEWRGGGSNHRGLIAGEPRDLYNEPIDFPDHHGRSQGYLRSEDVDYGPDRGYTADGRRQLTRADSGAGYTRDDRCYTSKSSERGRCAEAFDTYEGSSGGKERMDERHTQDENNFGCYQNGRPSVDAIEDYDALHYRKFSDYNHSGREKEVYEDYYRGDGLSEMRRDHELRYRKFNNYNHSGREKEDYEDYYRGDGRPEMRRDHEPSNIRRRPPDERALRRRSPSPEKQRRCVDSCENEQYVYRNAAYENDDSYCQERYSDGQESSQRCWNGGVSHEQRARQERSSRAEDHMSVDEQRDAVNSLPRHCLERYANRGYEREHTSGDHGGELHCFNGTSESVQSSARQHAGKNLPKLTPTRPPIMRESSTTTPRRTPLSLTTFAPSGEASGDLLDIPRCAESDSQQGVGSRKRAESLMTQGTQKFATMKNARRIAEEMGMEEATADARAEVEQTEEFLEEYEGRVKRTRWARRNQLQRSPAHEGDKFDAWDLKSFKAMKKASELGRDITTWLTMWSSALKTIEGHFGTGVVSYFLFLRWLLLLNLLMFLMPVLFIITPHSILPTVFEPNETLSSALDSPSALAKTSALVFSAVGLSAPSLPSTSDSLADDVWAAENRTLSTMQHCYQEYFERVASQTKGGISLLQDFLQGTGWMELTALFSGRYLNSVDHIAGTRLGYNFPLAYVLTNVACFVLCLLLMIRYTTAGVREALMVSEGNLHRYCNMVFASWDFCITDERTARLKHVSIVQELKSDLAEERRRAEIASWSRRKKVGLFIVRLLVNLLVLAVIGGSLFAVYHATSFSFQRQSQAQTTHETLALVIQFVPSLVITGLNLVVPALFSKLIRLENYSVAFQVKLTLLRTVFLRFTSIFVLLLSLYKQINCTPVREDNCLEGEGDCRKPMCWETAVGQQIYKLTILDFIVGVTLVFVVECPRKLIVTRFQCKLAKIIGQQEFNIPNRVLDLVYSQTLCWLGTFYCPLLPAVTMIKYFIIFYVQKFTLMNNSAPSQTPYRASRSNTFFVIVLLLALFLAVIPFAYALVEIQPSLSCGPFQQYLFTWQVVPELIHSWRNRAWGWYVVKAIDFLTSVAFGVPVVVVLAISIYYYYSVAAAHAHMEKVLKDKLVLEGKDKQFLLARITEVARQRPSSTA
ncbi:uncharacterized protein LOC144101114 isoform X1 [Amblyomma americanum]